MNAKSVSAHRLTKSTPDARMEFPVASVSHSFPVIAMAASVGGLKALSIILGGLPANFPAAIAIVMHLAPDHKSLLTEILKCRTHLQVTQAHTGDVLIPSKVFVAPPNHHLFVVRGDRLKLSSAHAKKVHFSRPSAEALFASVAKTYGKMPLLWCSPAVMGMVPLVCKSSRKREERSSCKTDPRRKISACRRLPSRLGT